MSGYMINKKLEELKTTLAQSLPSQTMLNNVSIGAIEINDIMIIIKNRYEDIPTMPFEYYSEQHDYGHHYKELQGKAIIFDIKLLNIRGKQALMDFYYR